MAIRYRENSFAIGGGAWGDEGKGKFTDYFASQAHQEGKDVIVYRVNGGANAGHTLEFEGKRIALHQIPCGAFVDGAKVVLGGGMVIHPEDLLTEINMVKEASSNQPRSTIKIDNMAALALDTHRAYEYVLKKWQTGISGSTGRGIAPAYADITLHQPLRIRDLQRMDWQKFARHYDLFSKQISGLGEDMSLIDVETLNKGKRKVGTKDEYIGRLKDSQKQLSQYIEDSYEFIRNTWSDEKNTYIFEMAQAIGLDPRYGVYPDITASDTTCVSITAATQGLVDYRDIKRRISTLKATYCSSVGSRILPSLMEPQLAARIREDAKEFGSTTKRPRDITYFDLPALRFYQRVGGANEIGLTHMDIVYPNTPVKICIDYQIDDKSVPYRPDQQWLDLVTPIYEELPTWDGKRASLAQIFRQLPQEAKDYVHRIESELHSPVTIIGNGPKREQVIEI
jgi:adenylosuccinate synthase